MPNLTSLPRLALEKTAMLPRANDVLDKYDTSPAKLMWTLTPQIRAGIRFVETRLSDLICENDCQALEFKGYGKNFITSHGFSPDALVQMAFWQAAYFGLYGRTECTYGPAMTKSFLYGRTETIRTVQLESSGFTKAFFSEATNEQKTATPRKVYVRHVALMKEWRQGLGQDRHLYCLYQRQLSGNLDPLSDDSIPSTTAKAVAFPSVFADPGCCGFSDLVLLPSGYGIG